MERSISPHNDFDIAFVDFDALALCDPTLDSFLGNTGYIWPPLPGLSPCPNPAPAHIHSVIADQHDVMDKSPGDNDNLDIDFDKVSLSAFLSLVDAPWLSTDASELDLLTASVDCVDPASRALHGATEFMKVYKVGCAGLHACLRTDTPLLCGDEQGHVDGGSMATTTNHCDLLWFYCDLSGPVPALKVADDTQHFPIGLGFLRVPDNSSRGYQEVECFYTPTLPVTIISPDKIGRQFRCTGYTSVSNFTGLGCKLRLYHCRRVSDDVSIPLQLCRGLLVTAPLLPPRTPADSLAP